VEEEIYLTSFLWEEAKHCEFFRRWLDEVAGVHEDLGRYITPAYETMFYQELSGSMRRLLDEPTRANQVRAAVTYTMVIEGVLAETGYEGFRRSMERNGYMPGLLQGVRLIARDESRHLRYGVYLLNRLVSEEGALWDVLTERMNEIFPAAMEIINEYWEHYDSDNGPFGVTMMEFVDLAGQLFDGRMRVLERDRGKRLADIETAVLSDMASEESAEAGKLASS
jgi:ribonucleoside-diphosphate reductase beta chain